MTTSQDGRDGFSPGRETVDWHVEDDENTKPRSPRGSRRSTRPTYTDQNLPEGEKKVRVVPEGVVIPDRGWPKFKYRLWKSGMLPVSRFPAINESQRLELEHQAKLAYREELIERLRYLSNLGIQPIICFANIKSAGKTTDAIGIGTVIAQHTRKNTLLVPSTTNTATATAGLMAGISGHSITVDTYMETAKQYGAFRALDEVVPRTKWGLGVIIEDSKSAADVDDHSKVKQYMEMVDITIPNVSVLILDLGNDNISKRSIALQAARLAHVLNFPFVMDNPVTHETLRRTLEGYNTDLGVPDDVNEELFHSFETKSMTGYAYSTRRKVEHSVVIANKVKPDTDVDFSDYTRYASQGAHADDLPTWKGTGICVPDEPSFGRKNDSGELLPFDYNDITLETEISFLEGAVANFEITGWATRKNISPPLVAKIPALHGRTSTSEEGAS